VTSVTGHVFCSEFPGAYQSRDITTVDPYDLFDADILKMDADKKGKMVSHLSKEAKNADYLVLWLDCDREGENICFETI